MGELEGIRGAWGYPEGGMGAVSDAIAKSAESSGAEIIVENPVQKVKMPIKIYKISNNISFWTKTTNIFLESENA